MADDRNGGGFGWFILGGIVGAAIGAYIATGPGREQIESLRSKTIENVNDITSGVNVGLRTGGRGMAAFGRGVKSAVYGVRVAGQSLVRTVRRGESDG